MFTHLIYAPLRQKSSVFVRVFKCFLGDLMSVLDNIRRIAKEHGLSLAEVNNKAGLGTRTIYHWNTKTPSLDNLSKVADVLHISVDDLLQDPANTVNMHINKYNNYADKDFFKVSIPVLGKIACGEPILAEQNIEEYRQLLFDHKPHGVLFCLKCKGDSMQPIIPNGSFATIRQQETVENGELAAVLIGDEATIKRVKYVGKTTLLMPENKKYDPIVLDEEHPGKILGKVIHVDYDIL